MMNKDQILELKNSVLRGGLITLEQAIDLSNSEHKELVYQSANEIRMAFLGNKFDLCSIENAKSGKCSEDCKWCSQSAYHSAQVEVYELVDQKNAVEMAKRNEAYGVKRYSLVTSGRGVSQKTLTEMIKTYQAIRQASNISFCASMGLLTASQLTQLKDVGVEHYHCNLETSRAYFPKVCTTHTYDDKIETIKMAQNIGLKICSGGIIGMGESMLDRLQMAFDLAGLGVQSIPINILNPIEGTPLSGASALSQEEILTTIALFRWINPKANLRFAGGRQILKSYQDKALQAGISSAVVGDLLTTLGSSGVREDIDNFKASGFDVD